MKTGTRTPDLQTKRKEITLDYEEYQRYKEVVKYDYKGKIKRYLKPWAKPFILGEATRKNTTTEENILKKKLNRS